MQKILLKKLIMLVMILLVCLPCINVLAQEEIPNNLTLEEPEILKIDNVDKVAFSVDGYATILKLYIAYDLYLETKEDIKKIKEMNLENINLYKQRLEIKDKEIVTLKEDREFIYSTLRKVNEEYYSSARKQKIKTILITGGSGLAGIGIGALIFFIASH